MKHDTVRATVSPETISKVTRLFNGTIGDILNELLQNARRAGASGVDVDAMPVENGLRVTIADDGCGIDDPARVLALGASRWDAAVANGEDPAGMGIFSLAGKPATIESRTENATTGWAIEIPADAWTGERDIAVRDTEIARGTSIHFDVEGINDGTLEHELTEAAKFFPLPVRFHGKEKPRQDFLAGAHHIENWNGSRIGIFKGRPYHRTPTVNFHGLTLFAKLFIVSQIDGEQLHAKVDIGTTPELQLVLPARKEFVDNAGLAALKNACEIGCYRALAREGKHSLTFEDYERARKLGVELPEAEACLNGWEPDIADGETGAEAGERREITGDEFLMDDHDAHFGQAIARALGDNPIRGKLVSRKRGFEGYSWYDELREFSEPIFLVTAGGITHRVDAVAADPPLATVTEAETIHLEFAIDEQGGRTAERESVDADLVFTFPDGCCSDGLDDVTIAFVRTEALTPEKLVDILDNACFSPWNDSEADSWDTQHDRFLRDARELAYRILIDENAAIASQFRDAVARIMWALPKGKHVEIAFTHDSPIAVEVSDLPETN